MHGQQRKTKTDSTGTQRLVFPGNIRYFMSMKKPVELAAELAQNVTTLEELSTMMRSLMKSTMERMLNTQLDVISGGHRCRP